MLLNYVELVRVVTPRRYEKAYINTPEGVVYQIPRKCGRALRRWLVRNFQLALDPPVDDGYTDKTRLGSLMTRSLMGQCHTLLDSIKRSKQIGVFRATVERDGAEKEITTAQVQSVLLSDLSSFPRFKEAWKAELQRDAPSTYRFPRPPGSSAYIVQFKSP